MAKRLIKLGADVRHKTHDKETTIMAAAEAGLNDMVMRLESLGVSMAEIDYWGESVLIKAVKGKNLDTVQYALQRGNDINLLTKQKERETALSIAISSAYVEIANYLLDHGAGDVQVINQTFFCPITRLKAYKESVNDSRRYSKAYIEDRVKEFDKLIKRLEKLGVKEGIPKRKPSGYYY